MRRLWCIYSNDLRTKTIKLNYITIEISLKIIKLAITKIAYKYTQCNKTTRDTITWLVSAEEIFWRPDGVSSLQMMAVR